MSVYLVTYDLMTPGKNYSLLYTRLNAWNAVRGLDSVWFIESQSTAATIRDDLRGYIDANDRLLVVELSGVTAWTQMLPLAANLLLSRFATA